MDRLGFVRCAAATPVLKVADLDFNGSQIIRCAKAAESKGAGLILFPELAITGCTCGDLFLQDFLYRRNVDELFRVASATKELHAALIVGFYLQIRDRYYNCAALLQGGRIMGIVPKMWVSPAEARWFAPGRELAEELTAVPLRDSAVPFGRLLFREGESGLTLGIEVGADRDASLPPAAALCSRGAHIICNPSADPEFSDSASGLPQTILAGSRRFGCGYLHAAAGVHESTTDQVFGGRGFIAETGRLLSAAPAFSRKNSVTFGELDYQRIQSRRSAGNPAPDGDGFPAAFTTVALDALPVLMRGRDLLTRYYSKNPFLPADPQEAAEYCDRVFQAQAAGLAKRLSHIGTPKALIGVSGGLDSTLSLLVIAEAFRMLERDPADIIAVTMPGFGTSDRTYRNAILIMRVLGATVKEIPIKDAVIQHLKDIGHDPDARDVTYENAQARERTQILMDLANKEGGLVVGTGDLSEEALGWCTFNGDHMSMYNVNGSVPKTLIPHVIRRVMERLPAKGAAEAGTGGNAFFCLDPAALKAALASVIDTPISPELLPTDENGAIAQKTEDSVGPYALHDFFLYHTVLDGASPARLFAMARRAFAGEYDRETIKKWLLVFYRRFFRQQYKRNCVPDGPQAGLISLSPRGGWSMPGDAELTLWLKEMQEL